MNDEGGWEMLNRPVRIRSFKFLCMNSAVIFEPIAKSARSVILASGTLSPTMTFESELGTKFAHKLHASHVITKDQVYIRGIAKGPNGVVLKATYQNTKQLSFQDDLGRLVYQICQKVPHGTLCFFSSYAMMESQLRRWSEIGLLDKLEKIKVVLREPKRAKDLDEVMRDYRQAIEDTANGPDANGSNGALLFAVFRGKVAEGIDFSDNEARCVMTIGIPYAVRSDPVIKLKIAYNDENRNRGLLPGREWYNVQAYRALNQALGRCIRHQNDWGAIILIDQRLASFNLLSSYLPKWIREMKSGGDTYNLSEDLKQFVSRQTKNDKKD